MESIKYFKFELDTQSREALKLINEKLKKGVEWGKNKYYYGKSKYYYGSDGSCLKGIKGLWVSNIISAEQMIEMLSEKKEPVKDEVIELEMAVKYKNGNISDYVKYDEIMIRDLLINNNVESVIIQKKDPLFEEFKKILTSFNSLEEQFNLAKELFNK